MATAATELEEEHLLEEELQQSPWSNVWKYAEKQLILEYFSLAVNTTRTLKVAAML